MKNFRFLRYLTIIIFYCNLNRCVDLESATAAQVGYSSITTWQAALSSLIENPYETLYSPEFIAQLVDYETTILSIKEFSNTMRECSQIFQRNYQDNKLWLDGNNLKPDFSFQAFVQKLIVKSDTIIAFWGDLHGSVHSLMRTLQSLVKAGYLHDNFKIPTGKNFYMIFLGDYSDRGKYGTEVLYTLAKLKIANPERVILVRGNHEDPQQNITAVANAPTLTAEFTQKMVTNGAKPTAEQILETQEKLMSPIFNFYNLLPSALYLGTEAIRIQFVQCSHGGIEMGYNPALFINAPKNILYQKIDRLEAYENALEIGFSSDDKNVRDATSQITDMIEKLPWFDINKGQYDFAPTKLVDLGFLWSDFSLNSNDTLNFNSSRGVGWIAGKTGVDALLKFYNTGRNNLVAFIRAHQHSGELLKLQWKTHGLVTLWDAENQVRTLLSAPDARDLKFNFDSYILVTTKRLYKNWKFDHIFTPIL